MRSGLGRIIGTSRHKISAEGEHWLSVSDLMAGLMMVFLFISIALMREARLERDQMAVERDKIKQIAVAYKENQMHLYNALMDEFQNDLSGWQAEISKEDLAFEFKSPDVLFEAGETRLRPVFQEILQDFFPRYLSVLSTYRDSIQEVRIEGHTSSDWNHKASDDAAYFNNMLLSQGRTREVLVYVYNLSSIRDERPWMKNHIAAVGYSSAHIIINDDGSENKERSRRVSFRVQTNAETQIRTILEE